MTVHLLTKWRRGTKELHSKALLRISPLLSKAILPFCGVLLKEMTAIVLLMSPGTWVSVVGDSRSSLGRAV